MSIQQQLSGVGEGEGESEATGMHEFADGTVIKITSANANGRMG